MNINQQLITLAEQRIYDYECVMSSFPQERQRYGRLVTILKEMILRTLEVEKNNATNIN